MADMLVRLYHLPPLQAAVDVVNALNIEIRPARVGEENQIMPWVAHHFAEEWSYGIAYAIQRNPSSLFIAVEKQAADPERKKWYQQPDEILVGFACYDTANRGMFGPMGVQPSHERRGIGKALLLTALHAMWSENYAYAIIGWAGPVEWYERTVGAEIIRDSEPGPFRGRLSGA